MRIAFTCLLFFLLHGAYAQQLPRPASGRFIVSAGGGFSGMQQAYLRDSAFAGNGWRMGADVFAGIWQRQLKSGALQLGLNVAGSYASQASKGGLQFVTDNYRLANGTVDPKAPEGQPGARILSFSAGPQLYWCMGKIYLAPAFHVGHTRFQRDGFRYTDSLADGGRRKFRVDFVDAAPVDAAGLTISPKLRAGVQITPVVSLWADVQYTAGPSVSSTITYWKPLGDPVDGAYNIGQYIEGKPLTRTTEHRYTSLGVQGGVAFNFGGNGTPKQPKTGNAFADASQVPASQPDTMPQRHPQRATAPHILSPDGAVTVGLQNDHLTLQYIPSNYPSSKMQVVIWKLTGSRREKVYDQTYVKPWDGRLTSKDLRLEKDGMGSYEAQLTASYLPGGVKLPFSGNTQPVYDNNGRSNIAKFNIQNNCTVDHQFVLDSTKCLEDDKIRVYGHVQILPNSAGVTTGTISFTPPFLETVNNTSVTPSAFQPGPSFTVTQTPVTFSFDISGDMCEKKLRVYYNFSYQCPTLNTPALIPCADTIALPCCICNYCDDPANMNITTGAQTLTQNGELFAITQQFTISPKNITKVTAQIVYMEETGITADCRSCAKDETSVYHFTGTNTAQWNGGAAINAAAANSQTSFPSKLISWATNAQGNLSLHVETGLPGLAQLSCCSRNIKICIRYSFTDKECKTCEKLVCYEGVQHPNQSVNAKK